MRTLLLVLGVVALLLIWTLSNLASSYSFSGYVDNLLVGAPALLLALVGSPPALLALAWAFFRRPPARPPRQHTLALALLLAVAWATCPWFLGRGLFLRGLAWQVARQTSPAEIRAVAERCLELLPAGGMIQGPGKPAYPVNPGVWAELSAHPVVRREKDTIVILVRPPLVELSWGGALPGHHGIRYSARPDLEGVNQPSDLDFLAGPEPSYGFYREH